MPGPGSLIPRASSILLGTFVLVVVLQHVLQPGLSPADHRLSEYATGSPGWLMTVGFAAWSGALLATAIGAVGSSLRPRGVTRAIAALLVVAAAGAAATAMCKTGTIAGVLPPGHHLTTANRIHDLGSGSLGLALWGAVVVSLGVADRRLRMRTGVLLAGGVVAALLLSGGLLELPGVRQRVLVAVACAWQFLLLTAIARSQRECPRAGHESVRACSSRVDAQASPVACARRLAVR